MMFNKVLYPDPKPRGSHLKGKWTFLLKVKRGLYKINNNENIDSLKTVWFILNTRLKYEVQSRKF